MTSPTTPASESIQELVRQVSCSARYQHVCPDLIERLGGQELRKHHRLKEAVKATRRRLHQIGGAYFLTQPTYERWSQRLATAVTCGEAALQSLCREILQAHASTRERLPILDDFYATILADIPPVESVLDVACGLNPLALPWMPLNPSASYDVLDIYADMLGFVQQFLQMRGVAHRVFWADVLDWRPDRTYDLVLVLKLLPCLEQLAPASSATLLGRLSARDLLVSYPVQSLGGRSCGMRLNYEESFRTICRERDWEVRTYHFATELAFLVHCPEYASRQLDSQESIRL